jgi:predicted nucleic acid-binding protein
MKLSARIGKARLLFLDTAPVIYYIEGDTQHLAHADIVFNALDNLALSAVTSPITLAECLIVPLRNADENVRKAFIELILNSHNIHFHPSDKTIAIKAAELRATYNLSLTDAFQVATAIVTECDAFLTNDAALKRVKEIHVIVLDEFEPA